MKQIIYSQQINKIYKFHKCVKEAPKAFKCQMTSVSELNSWRIDDDDIEESLSGATMSRKRE